MSERSIPSLADLPAPPEGKTGWPWTADGAGAQSLSPPHGGWPRITVVTPSFNQAEFLEETLRSVLLQGYPGLEYIVIDGGSSDDSADILRRYDHLLSHWCSEPDRGQTHAINKGFARSTGDIMAWLNSDDSYYPGALFTATRELAGSERDLLFGRMDKVDAADSGRVVKTSSPREGVPCHRFRILREGNGTGFHFFQPAMFWKRTLWEAAGPLDEGYEYMMDLEWCNRALAARAGWCTTDQVLARFTLHPDSKTVSLRHRQLEEELRMYFDLGRRPEFRGVQCLLSALRPAQSVLYLKAEQAVMDGRQATAAVHRTGARIIRAVTTWVPGFKGRTAVGS
jgi:glycosyltransferase involved in cell wall biosynthesis